MQTKIKRWPQGHLFLQRRGNGSPRPRSALAMTPQKFTLSFRTSAHTGVGIRSPCRSGRPCPPGSGSAALCRTGPTCPATRRISPAKRWQEMLRITRQTQSVSLLRQGSVGPRERPADGAAEIIRKLGANFAHPGPRGKRRPTWTTPQPRKGFQNLGFGALLVTFPAWEKSPAAGRQAASVA